MNKKIIKFTKKKIINFFVEKNLKHLIKLSNKRDLDVNQLKSKKPYKPNLIDLYSLYKFVIDNNRTTVLEFGSGWSTLIFCIALAELKKKYKKKVKKLRRNNPFEIFVVDNEKKFLSITKKRINNYFKNKCPIKIHYNLSKVKMTTFNGRIATEFKKLPNCNPDFIYLDGPDQFNVASNINGISTRHKDMVPMSCDILKLEHFFNPDTIIVIDGRRSNAIFLKKNFQNNWSHKYLNVFDQHVFRLREKPQGEVSKQILKFYKFNK